MKNYKAMKTKSFMKNTLAILTLLIATNCTSDLAKLNSDPTAVGADQLDPNYILTTAQMSYTGSADFSYETWRAQLIYCSVMTQHFATTIGYWAGDKYQLNQAYAESYFLEAYQYSGANLGQVGNAVILLNLTKDKAQHSNLYQIGRIWKATIFHRITDLYGDVPYTEAGQAYYKGILTPKYDTQQDIYTDMLKELDEAAAALDPSKDIPTGDLVYNGDIAKWKKFAYSMMLRLATRLSKVDPANSKKYIEKAAAGGVFTSINDNAFIVGDPTHGRSTINRISQVLDGSPEHTDVKWSKTFIDFMKNNNDPRLAVVATLTSGDSNPAHQLGLPNGLDQAGGAQDISTDPNYPGSYSGYSVPNKTILAKDNAPTFVITYAETELMLAEAAQLNYTVTGSAATHYNNGVTAAMAQLVQFDASATIPAASITTYLAANPYDPTNGVKMINTQYWAATIFNDYETFANWRRSGYPALAPVNYPNNATGGVTPRRLIYPQSEASTNGDNYNAAIARITGGNTLVGRVWWDK